MNVALRFSLFEVPPPHVDKDFYRAFGEQVEWGGDGDGSPVHGDADFGRAFGEVVDWAGDADADWDAGDWDAGDWDDDDEDGADPDDYEDPRTPAWAGVALRRFLQGR